MINTLLAVKKQMTSGYDIRGRRVGATVLEVRPNFVTHIKNADTKDGYSSIQLGTGIKKSVRKPQQGHLKKAGVSQNVRWLREVRLEDGRRKIDKNEANLQTADDLNLGQEIKVNDVFVKGDLVKVTGTSKGRGFAGGVKRFNFRGGPKTHGQSDRHRAPGSSGSGTTPGRVYKGKRRPGHMGVETVSYMNMEVLNVDLPNNLVTVKGGIPGYAGNLVLIQKQGHVKGHVPEPEVSDEIGTSENQNTGESEQAELPVTAENLSPETVAAVETAGVPESSVEEQSEVHAEEAAKVEQSEPAEPITEESAETVSPVEEAKEEN
jgi:large subunit ribosomal protein L3